MLIEHPETRAEGEQTMKIDSLYKIKKKETEKASLILGAAFHDDPV